MILVTGATGLVGSHLLYQICQSEKRVRATKRVKSNTDFVNHVFSYYTDKPDELFKKIDWVEADLLNISELDLAFEGITKVYHCAAWISFNPKQKDKMMRTNIESTSNVVNLCLAHQVEKLCHVSSTAAIAKALNKKVIDERNSWVKHAENSSYAISKHLSEMEVWRGSEEGLNTVIVCPAIILGPGKWEKGSSLLFKQVWQGMRFYSSGTNGFVDVRDVTKVMIRLMESDIKSERFILCSESIPFKQALDYIANGLGKENPFIEIGPFLSDISWRIAKIISLFTGKSPLITKETMLAANSISVFENSKIKKVLSFEFKPIEQSCKEFSILFLKDYAGK